MSQVKILISSLKDQCFHELCQHLKKQGTFAIFEANDGKSTLDLLYSQKPDILFLDLMLTAIHSLQIMKEIKASDLNTKVIIYSVKSIEQDYNEAIELGASYYIIKPCPLSHIDHVIEQTLNESLTPLGYRECLELSCPKVESPFYTNQEKTTKQKLPKSISLTAPTHKNYMKFWGTRGSIPVSGYEHLLYGGNTSCLEICYEDELIIIDAGTGIRALSKEIIKKRNFKKIHLFISHTHWDHILGFPFFLPLYNDEYKIHVYAPKGPRKSIQDIFTGMLAREYFPVSLEEMAAKFQFHNLDGIDELNIGKLKINLTYANHPGPCVCFKIQTKDQCIAYATDNEIFTGFQGHPNEVDENHFLYKAYEPLINFFKPCDLLIHEAQYTPMEYSRRIGWGHSSITNASILAKLCKPEKWYVTHHDPEATDENLMNRLLIHKEVLEESQIPTEVHLAYDYLTLPL